MAELDNRQSKEKDPAKVIEIRKERAKLGGKLGCHKANKIANVFKSACLFRWAFYFNIY